MRPTEPPPDRAPAARLTGSQLLTALLHSMANAVLILNAQRQIVFANRNTLTQVPQDNLESLLGLRPGETLGGTTVYCSVCGLLRAILTSLDGASEVQECHLSRTTGDTRESLDLQIFSRPFTFEGATYSIVAVTDMGDEKRRQVLERIFFHDIATHAGGVEGLVEIINDRIPEDLRTEMNLVGNGVRADFRR